ncbi:MAG: hypothetical protein R3263_09855, partial [Myxococcota bacterium]|nr:hypothetical protein [Myxococcota bacterium]
MARTSTRMLVAGATAVYRPLFRRAARQVLEGRLLDPDRPREGRWLRADVDAWLDAVWERVPALLPEARLDELPTLGNRHNVLLAVMTTAAYQAMVARGVERAYAMELVGDVGWKIYAGMLGVASLPARLLHRDPAARMERTLRLLMRFPFSAPGRPGYEVEAWSEDDRFHTHWTHCPPQSFVRSVVERRGDGGELEAFRRSWCRYDWAGADLLAGDGRRGHYARPHTLSHGDPVCDMC